MQRSLRESLGAGCRTSVGASLVEGLRWLDRESFDLAIVRLPMPDARGLQAIVELQRSSVDLPVIALREEGENEAVREAADSLADDCLVWEEANAERLGQSVELALERREMLRALKAKRGEQVGRGSDAVHCREIVESLDQSVLVISRATGELLFANQHAKSELGRSLPHAIEKAMELQELEERGTRVEILLQQTAFKHAELRRTPLHWRGQSAFLVTLRDISRRKQAEEGWSLSRRLVQQMREERSEDARASRLGSGQKILVAEDEPVLRLAVSSAARSLGFTVVEACDGIEALELYRKHGGDFLFALIDLNMPRMDGKRLLSAIREHRKSLPVAVMSGEDDEPKAWLVENGADSCFYLSKPFGISGLKRMVAELKALADHRSGQPA